MRRVSGGVLSRRRCYSILFASLAAISIILSIILLGKFLRTFDRLSNNRNIQKEEESYEYQTQNDNNSFPCTIRLWYKLSNNHSNFHSNHWFHLGEYYLSRMSTIRRDYDKAINLINSYHNSRCNNKSYIDRTNPNTNGVDSARYSEFNFEVIVEVSSQRFLVHITPMTIFFLTLSFNHCNASTVTLLYAGDKHTITHTNIPIMPVNRLNYEKGEYSYRNTIDYEKQYVLKRRNDLHHEASMNRDYYEVMYMGEYGESPISSNAWFRSVSEVDAMRKAIKKICPIQTHPIIQSLLSRYITRFYCHNRNYSSQSSKTRKLVIYQRDNNRRFVRLHKFLQALCEDISNQWSIYIVSHDDSIHPCVLFSALQDADLFFTTHGFQSVGSIFMKPGASIYEIFPYRYFKNSYLMLARQLGIRYYMRQNEEPTSWSRAVLRVVSQERCMSSRRCRSYARGDDVSILSTSKAYLVNLSATLTAIEYSSS